jgi:hypothetical protein
MSYENAREAEIHDAHQRLIDAFATTYRVGQPTVVLLPGGMGSHLDRSTRPYRNDASIPFEAYDPVWMDLEIFFGRDAAALRIQDNGHDEGDYVIVPNGPLRFLVDAYDGTQRFFRNRGWNYLVFGYDWRRPIAEAAAQLESFLANVRYRVKELRDADPLPTTTLLAHSQGGLVAKVFLHRIGGSDGSGVARWCERLVTVGTPFYGTASHHDRYYVGQPPLNTFYGTRFVADLAGSLPGPYILMTADRNTLSPPVLARLGLPAYPMTDTQSGQPADPYDPAESGRFPSWVNRSHLAAARSIRRTIAANLPPRALERVFHVRSGLDTKTGAALRWDSVDGAAYDPQSGSPIHPVKGAGDGTVPFWSARLAQTPDAQVYDLAKAKSHGHLCEHAETLEVLALLVDERRLPDPSRITAKDESLGVQPASAARTRAFLRDAHSGALAKGDPRANDPAVWRRLFDDLSLC